MERADGEASTPTPAARGGAPAPAGPGAEGGMVTGRSCKGCLYYSSALRSRARGPVCVGVTRAIPQGQWRYYPDPARHGQHPIRIMRS